MRSLTSCRRFCAAASRLTSPRVRAQCETDALESLRGALDPSLVRVQQLSVSSTGQVSFNLEFLSGVCPQRDELCATAADTVASLSWAEGPPAIRTTLSRPGSFMGHKAPASLAHVGALIGVSSCKGGVGKSTLATNLAFSVAALGGRVGLLDADVHGPSLPSLVSLEPETLPLVQRGDTKLLVPPVVGGVKLMSYGFIAKGASQGKVGAAVMRGPMVGKVVSQMVSGTEWGALDFLFVDLPPGTGDVQLTLCQSFGLSGAVVVTTPQRLAKVDVLKGIAMFDELRVPLLSLLENMAYFTDPHGGVHHPFGTSQLESICERSGVPSSAAFRLPIEQHVTAACDEGVPLVVARPDSEAAAVVRAAAAHLAGAVRRLQHESAAAPQLRYEPRRGLVMRVLDEGAEYVLDHAALALLPDFPPHAPKKTPVEAVELCAAPGGEPSVRISWSGGGESIVSCERFKSLAGV